MNDMVKQLIKAADESERVFGLRNQVVIAHIGGRKRNRRRTVQFIRELDGEVVGRVHYSDQTGTLQWMPVQWHPPRASVLLSMRPLAHNERAFP